MTEKDHILETTRNFLEVLPPGAEITVSIRFGALPLEADKTVKKDELTIFEKVFETENNNKSYENGHNKCKTSVMDKSEFGGHSVKARRQRSVCSESSDFQETELLFPLATLIPKENVEAFRANERVQLEKKRRAKELALSRESDSEFSEKIKKRLDSLTNNKNRKKKNSSRNKKSVTQYTAHSDMEPTERLFPKARYIPKEENYEDMVPQ